METMEHDMNIDNDVHSTVSSHSILNGSNLEHLEIFNFKVILVIKIHFCNAKCATTLTYA